MRNKNYILTPGPVPVPFEVLSKAAEPIMHHRTPQFSEIFKEVSEDLKYVFQTKNEVYIFASSGTGAMESAVVNVMQPGEKAIVVRGGKFGERWGEICQAYNINFVPIDFEWGYPVEVEQIEKALKENPDAKAVFTTLCETSTGVTYDIKSIGEFMKDKPQLLIVDAISALAVEEFYQDAWNVDIVVAGSQKGIMLPPGLAFISVSEKAWKVIENNKKTGFYFNLKAMKKNLAKATTPFTPAISLIMQLKVALNIIKNDGLENMFKRHKLMAHATREAAKALGLKLFAKKNSSNVCTSIEMPENIEAKKLTKKLRDEYGVTIAAGQGQIENKIIRIAHFGFIDKFDLIVGISAVEIGLNQLGYKVELGKGLAVAEKILFEL